ncbi:hypothetical protein TKK_0016558 [Trichogramma kaykai]
MEQHMEVNLPMRLTFCANLDKKFTKKSFKIDQSPCRYFGKPKITNDEWINKLFLLKESAETFHRMSIQFIKKLDTTTDSFNRQILSEEQTYLAVPTTKISHIAVHVKVLTKEYLTAVPHMLHY